MRTETNRVFVLTQLHFYFERNLISGNNSMLIIQISGTSCPFVRKTRDTRLLRPVSNPSLASISSSLHRLLSSSWCPLHSLHPGRRHTLSPATRPPRQLHVSRTLPSLLSLLLHSRDEKDWSNRSVGAFSEATGVPGHIGSKLPLFLPLFFPHRLFFARR